MEDLVNAGDALVDAIRAHARALAASSASRDIHTIIASSEVLWTVALKYADAQFDLTGTAFPFGALRDLADEQDDADEYAEDVVVGDGISIVSRRDFVVVDEEQVLSEGRSAYRSVMPSQSPIAVDGDVDHVGGALYQFAHVHGWNSLDQMSGLAPVAAITVTYQHSDLLRGEPHKWPESPFILDGPVVYTHADVYGRE